jgi:hypothetical protein
MWLSSEVGDEVRLWDVIDWTLPCIQKIQSRRRNPEARNGKSSQNIQVYKNPIHWLRERVAFINRKRTL